MKVIAFTLNDVIRAYINHGASSMLLNDTDHILHPFLQEAPDDLEFDHYFNQTSNWDTLNDAGSYLNYNPEDQTFFINWPFEDKPLGSALIFSHIIDFANWVRRCEDDKEYPWERNAWVLDYCSSDDDGDYNSGYLYLCVALIEFYLLTEKLTYPELTLYHTPNR